MHTEGMYADPGVKKIYVGHVTARHLCAVTVNGQPLSAGAHVSHHPATGFEWGENSKGAKTLAIALMNDMYGPQAAEKWHGLLHQLVTKDLTRGHWWSLTDKDFWLILMQTSQCGGDAAVAAKFLFDTYHT